MNDSSKPNGGALAAAIIAFLLTAVFVAGSILFALAFYTTFTRSGGPPILVVEATILGFLASLGAFSTSIGIGLLRLRNWARISAIVLAGVMVFFCGSAELILALLFRSTTVLPPGGLVLRVFFLLIFGFLFLLAISWLIVCTRKSVVAQFEQPGSTNQTVQAEVSPARVISNPFEVLRGRAVLGRLILAQFAGLIFFIACRIALGRSFDYQSPLFRALVEVVFVGVFASTLIQLFRRAALRPADLFGQTLHWGFARRYWALPILLVGVSAGSKYAFFFPLSFGMPRFVDWYLFRTQSKMIVSSGLGYQWANILWLISAVAIAPIVEELAFRGILLTRWSVKWGAPRAILVSSAIFGILHKEFLGHMFFGYVMAVLYIETKSLFAPILVHAANNAIAWIWSLAALLWGSGQQTTLTTFQSDWHFGLLMAVLFIPWAVWFLSRHVPQSNWKMPYSAQSPDEVAASGARACFPGD